MRPNLTAVDLLEMLERWAGRSRVIPTLLELACHREQDWIEFKAALNPTLRHPPESFHSIGTYEWHVVRALLAMANMPRGGVVLVGVPENETHFGGERRPAGFDGQDRPVKDTNRKQPYGQMLRDWSRQCPDVHESVVRGAALSLLKDGDDRKELVHSIRRRLFAQRSWHVPDANGKTTRVYSLESGKTLGELIGDDVRPIEYSWKGCPIVALAIRPRRQRVAMRFEVRDTASGELKQDKSTWRYLYRAPGDLGATDSQHETELIDELEQVQQRQRDESADGLTLTRAARLLEYYDQIQPRKLVDRAAFAGLSPDGHALKAREQRLDRGGITLPREWLTQSIEARFDEAKAERSEARQRTEQQDNSATGYSPATLNFQGSAGGLGHRSGDPRVPRDADAVLLVAPPGWGKTMYLAELAERLFASASMCKLFWYVSIRDNEDGPGQVVDFVRSMALRTLQVAPIDERPELLRRLAQLNLEDGQIDEAFRELVVEPLGRTESPSDEPMYLLIDGLDESVRRTHRGVSISGLVGRARSELPAWMRIVATTRAGVRAVSKHWEIGRSPRIRLIDFADHDADAPTEARREQATADIRAFLDTSLGLKLIDGLPAESDAGLSALTDEFAERCEGIFLRAAAFVHLMPVGEAEDALRRLRQHPTRDLLSAMFEDRFERRYGDAQAWRTSPQAGVFAALVANGAGLTRNQIDEVVRDLNPDQPHHASGFEGTVEFLRTISGDGDDQPQHDLFRPELRDWLCLPDNRFRPDLHRAHSVLARIALRTLASGAQAGNAAWSKVWAGRRVVHHLVAALSGIIEASAGSPPSPEASWIVRQLRKRLGELDPIAEGIRRRGVSPMIDDFRAALTVLERLHARIDSASGTDIAHADRSAAEQTQARIGKFLEFVTRNAATIGRSHDVFAQVAFNSEDAGPVREAAHAWLNDPDQPPKPWAELVGRSLDPATADFVEIPWDRPELNGTFDAEGASSDVDTNAAGELPEGVAEFKGFLFLRGNTGPDRWVAEISGRLVEWILEDGQLRPGRQASLPDSPELPNTKDTHRLYVPSGPGQPALIRVLRSMDPESHVRMAEYEITEWDGKGAKPPPLLREVFGPIVLETEPSSKPDTPRDPANAVKFILSSDTSDWVLFLNAAWKITVWNLATRRPQFSLPRLRDLDDRQHDADPPEIPFVRVDDHGRVSWIDDTFRATCWSPDGIQWVEFKDEIRDLLDAGWTEITGFTKSDSRFFLRLLNPDPLRESATLHPAVTLVVDLDPPHAVTRYEGWEYLGTHRVRDSEWLSLGDTRGHVRVIDLSSRNEIAYLAGGHERSIESLSFASPEGREQANALTFGRDGLLLAWSWSLGVGFVPPGGSVSRPRAINSAKFLPSREAIATLADDGSLVLCKLDAGQGFPERWHAARTGGDQPSLRDLYVWRYVTSAGARSMLAMTPDGELAFWSLPDAEQAPAKLRQRLRLDQRLGVPIAIRGTERAVVPSVDGLVHCNLLNDQVETPPPIAADDEREAERRSKRFASGDDFGLDASLTIVSHSVPRGVGRIAIRPGATWQWFNHGSSHYCHAWLPDASAMLFAGGIDRRLMVWPSDSPEPINTTLIAQHPIFYLAVCRDGRCMAYSDPFGRIHVRHLHALDEVGQVLNVGQTYPNAFWFSVDGLSLKVIAGKPHHETLIFTRASLDAPFGERPTLVLPRGGSPRGERDWLISANESGHRIYRLRNMTHGPAIATMNEDAVAFCPNCGQRLERPDLYPAVEDARRFLEITQASGLPLLNLPPGSEQAWRSGELNSGHVCPRCKVPLRFNPFLIRKPRESDPTPSPATAPAPLGTLLPAEDDDSELVFQPVDDTTKARAIAAGREQRDLDPKPDNEHTLVDQYVLPFYSGEASGTVRLVRLRDPRWATPGLSVRFLQGPGAPIRLDGQSPPIHDFNRAIGLRLRSRQDFAQYLRFFGDHVHAEEGPFTIVGHHRDLPIPEDSEALDSPETVTHGDVSVWEQLRRIEPPRERVTDEVGNRSFRCFMHYGNSVFTCEMVVGFSGNIMMTEDEWVLIAPWLERASVLRASPSQAESPNH